jgi:hypothetical protein
MIVARYVFMMISLFWWCYEAIPFASPRGTRVSLCCCTLFLVSSARDVFR